MLIIFIFTNCSNNKKEATIIPAFEALATYDFEKEIIKVNLLDNLYLKDGLFSQSRVFEYNDFQGLLNSDSFNEPPSDALLASDYDYYVANYVIIGCAGSYSDTEFSFSDKTLIVTNKYSEVDLSQPVCHAEPKETFIIFGVKLNN